MFVIGVSSPYTGIRDRKCREHLIRILGARQSELTKEVAIHCWNCREGRKGWMSPAHAVYCSNCGAQQNTGEESF